MEQTLTFFRLLELSVSYVPEACTQWVGVAGKMENAHTAHAPTCGLPMFTMFNNNLFHWKFMSTH